MDKNVIGMVAGNVAGTALDMATKDWQYRKQREQAQKLQDMQIQGSKEMGEFNQGLALDMWNKTNYEAQRKHLENAGLNVGLMYGMSGGGGVTAHTPTGSVGGQNAEMPKVGMGIDMAQIALAKAQIDNINADTKLKESQVPKASQEISESKARIDKLIAETTNEELRGLLIAYQTESQRIENEQKQQSFPEILRGLKANADKTTAQAKKEGIQADKELQVINGNLAEQAVRISAAKAGIKLDQAQVAKIGAEIWRMKEANAQDWNKLSIDQQKALIQKQGVDFATSTPEQIHQWLRMVTEIVNTIKGTPQGGDRTTIGGFGG